MAHMSRAARTVVTVPVSAASITFGSQAPQSVLTSWPVGMSAGLQAEATYGATAPGAQAEAASDALTAGHSAGTLQPTNASLGLPLGPTDLPLADVVQSAPIDLYPGRRFAEDEPPVSIVINVVPDDARAIIEFWSDIFKEHMEFYMMWVSDYTDTGINLKAAATDLKRRWETYRHAYVGGQYGNDGVGLDVLTKLVRDTGYFKNAALDAVRAGGDYIGAVFESFVLDNLWELGYFVDALANGPNLGGQAEVDMWNEHARGHAFLDSHMFDPLMANEVAQALQLAHRFAALSRSQGTPSPVAPLGGSPQHAGSVNGFGAVAPTPRSITDAMNRLASVSDSPAAASEAYLDALQTVRLRLDDHGARVSGIAPHLLVSHSIREIAYGLERIRQIQSTAF